MESSKVVRHPDKEELIKMLLNGDSVKQIEAWLKKKYPRSKRHHISYMTLQKFRSENLNIKGNLLEDIKTKKKSDELVSADAEIRMAVMNSSEYQNKISEIVSNEMDVARKLLEMEKLISSRMEFYFNSVSSGGNLKGDRVFLEYLNTMRSIMQDWKKYVDGFADKKIEHNVNVNIVDGQLKIMKEVVVEVLREMDPALVLVFMEKINYKMSGLKHGTPEYNQYLIGVTDAEEKDDEDRVLLTTEDLNSIVSIKKWIEDKLGLEQDFDKKTIISAIEGIINDAKFIKNTEKNRAIIIDNINNLVGKIKISKE
jgi:hypothetical protein